MDTFDDVDSLSARLRAIALGGMQNAYSFCMMRIAIPHWQNQISPVLDVAGTLLVVDVDRGSIICRKNVAIEGGNPQTRARFVVKTAVNLLICGAISKSLERALVRSGIDVIANTCGDTEQVLAAFLMGQLEQKKYLMPGCSRGRKRRGDYCLDADIGKCRRKMMTQENIQSDEALSSAESPMLGDMDLRIYPDSVLRKLCEPVDRFDGELREWIGKMICLMRECGGVGLAAPQVGISQRFFVFELADKVFFLANPSIVERNGRSQLLEGCLSLPKLSIEVERNEHLEVASYDAFGGKQQHTFSGIWAHVVQHEVDHLNGVLICDYTSECSELGVE